MKILERGHVLGLQEASRLESLTFPAKKVLPSGWWLAGFRAADKKKDGKLMKAMMTWSDGGGKTWILPFEPVPLPPIGGRTGNSHSIYFLALGGSRVMMVINWVDASEPKAPFFDPQNESLKDTRIFYGFSENDGRPLSTFFGPLMGGGTNTKISTGQKAGMGEEIGANPKILVSTDSRRGRWLYIMADWL